MKAARGTLRVVGRDQRATVKRPAAGGPAKLRKAEITLHGRRVAYRTGGWGPQLVLIHGITSNSATSDRVLPALSQRYSVLAPDLLGHGRSDKLRGDYSVGAHANTIRDLLDALGIRKAAFVRRRSRSSRPGRCSRSCSGASACVAAPTSRRSGARMPCSATATPARPSCTPFARSSTSPASASPRWTGSTSRTTSRR